MIKPGERNTSLHGFGRDYKTMFPETWKEKLHLANRTYLDPPLPDFEVDQLIIEIDRRG